MATLFGIVTIAMVAAFGLAPDDTDELALEARAGAPSYAVRTLTPAEKPRPDNPAADSGATDELSTQGRERAEVIDDGPGLAELAVYDATVAEEVEPEPEEEPAAPTTVATTTTEAPTTTTTVAEDTTSSSDTAAGDGTGEETTTSAGDGTETSETTDTTAPGETTETTATTEAPPATTHPDGYVDAGHGVFVPQVLLDIRYCESRDNYTAANPSSSARGAYQFLTGSWAAYGHADRYGVNQAHLATPAQQDEAALITWQRDGTRPWNASKSCWG